MLLPWDIVSEVIPRYLSLKTFGSYLRLNHRFSKLSNSRTLWTHFLSRDFNFTLYSNTQPDKAKILYRLCCINYFLSPFPLGFKKGGYGTRTAAKKIRFLMTS